MNTQRINDEIDLAMDRLLKKGIVDLPKTFIRVERSDRLWLFLDGHTFEEKAYGQLQKLKELIYQDMPTFYTQVTPSSKVLNYRLDRDQFDESIADYLMSFTFPTTDNVDVSIWEMKFYDAPKAI